MKTLYFFNSSDRKIRDIIRNEGLYVGVTYRGRNTTKDAEHIDFIDHPVKKYSYRAYINFVNEKKPLVACARDVFRPEDLRVAFWMAEQMRSEQVVIPCHYYDAKEIVTEHGYLWGYPSDGVYAQKLGLPPSPFTVFDIDTNCHFLGFNFKIFPEIRGKCYSADNATLIMLSRNHYLINDDFTVRKANGKIEHIVRWNLQRWKFLISKEKQKIEKEER